jgi:hypothetical protein
MADLQWSTTFGGQPHIVDMGLAQCAWPGPDSTSESLQPSHAGRGGLLQPMVNSSAGTATQHGDCCGQQWSACHQQLLVLLL